MPPRRYSLYFTEPSGNVCVWPTRYPVFGSPNADTSGTARILAGRVPFAVAIKLGTTPAWYAGWANSRLVPPPPPPLVYEPGGAGVHAPLTRFVRPVSQPVSNR